MLAHAVVAAVLVFAPLPLTAVFPSEATSAPVPAVEPSAIAVPISANDNRVPAGKLVKGTLTLELTVVRGQWYPEEDSGPHLSVLAFAERGRAPSIPGPLIRVPAGTKMRVAVANPLAVDLFVLGMSDHPAPASAPVRIAPGTTHTFEFTASAAGTYGYAAFIGQNRGRDFAEGSQLAGAFIVDDPSDKRPDRVFVVGVRFQEKDSTETGITPEQVTMVLNGKSWPHTERMWLTEGDSVRWRVVNMSVDPHPMHLHGFYFRVDSRGAWNADTVYTRAQQRLAVTELMYPGSTFTMTFLPTEPGNWIFHCHFAFHVGPHVALATAATNGEQHAHAGNRHMSGLVLGIHVQPRGEVTQRGEPARTLNLFVQSKPRRYKEKPGFAFLLQEDDREPAADSLPERSSTLVLTRGERVRINVINRMGEATAIHWHGIELESFPDGVPDFSGMPDNLFTKVPAGESFAAVFTPPRAGTFIYHSHLNEMDQIMSGLFGPLIVLEPGERLDPEHDKIFIVGGAGPPPESFEDPQMGTINGETDPGSVQLTVGQTYRFRLININPDWRVELTLGSDTALVQWRPVAKDGADLPEHQRVPRAAYLLTGPGETADFEFTPTEPGFLRLAAKTRGPGWHTRVTMRVTPGK